MGWRWLMLVGVLAPACSFTFVHELGDTARKDPRLPLDCTTSRALPVTDFVLGAAFAGLVAATTVAFVEDANEDCETDGHCFSTVKPAVLAAFLVAAPWWGSAAYGGFTTGRCRDAYRARGFSPP